MSIIDKDDCNKLRAIADRIDREMAEKERMKKENDELRDELDDWRGNAEGFEPDAYMKLPVDADGVPIRIDDVVYGNPGIAWTVVGLRTSKFGWEVEMGNMPFLCEPDDLTHKKPDSWEKLEEDAKKITCDYAHAPRDEDGLTTCEGCRFGKGESCHTEMALDMVKRAKKLAGIEEGGAE